jgi:medium-chain acyl-[acyl-carrier-protein] hydrolase
MGNNWIVRFERRIHVGTTLYCFPCAGSGASIFRDFSTVVPEHVEVVGVQYPGRETRIGEAPLRNLRAIAEGASASLLPELRSSDCLLGFSMGAIVAFEVARLLQRAGVGGPQLLIACACPAPQLPRRERPIFNLPDQEFLEELEKLGGGSKDFFSSPELIRLMLPTIRADFEALESYRYQREAPLECSVLAVAGEEDLQVKISETEAWRMQGRKDFLYHTLKGNHFSPVRSPRELARLITRTMAFQR